MTDIVKVVRIHEGKPVDAVIRPDYDGDGGQIWFPEHLKKDGGFPANRLPNGWLLSKRSINLSHYALYQADRETLANPIRERIEELRELMRGAESRLLDVYRVNKERDA